jgi:glyoxylase-like metal-dependent hydrolase (beta-lactamase superfamily II)
MAAMKLRLLSVGPIACNCAIVACAETGQAAVIDPGGDPERILAAVREMAVEVKTLLHTHGHFDHILATREVAEATGAKVAIHGSDRPMYEDLPGQGRMFGFSTTRPPAPDQILTGGETISVGSLSAAVIHTPGHTPGSVGFHFQADGILFAGDTLFAESIGRTDLPGGSFSDILESIQGKLYLLPGDTRVIPGHGPETTIAREREDNPFVRARPVRRG